MGAAGTACRAVGLTIVIVVVALSQGCAVGQKVDYGNATMFSLRVSAPQVAVGVQDRRPYVASRDKGPQFVGLQRGGFGNPFDVETESGRPLSDEMAGVIAHSLRQRGTQVTIVPLQVLDTPEVALERFARSGAPRALHVTIDEWKSDSYNGTGLAYALVAVGYEASGRKLGDCRVAGDDDLGGSMGIRSAKEALPAEMAKRLEQLLSDPALDLVLR